MVFRYCGRAELLNIARSRLCCRPIGFLLPHKDETSSARYCKPPLMQDEPHLYVELRVFSIFLNEFPSWLYIVAHKNRKHFISSGRTFDEIGRASCRERV